MCVSRCKHMPTGPSTWDTLSFTSFKEAHTKTIMCCVQMSCNVTGIISALIHNINRQAMNLRAESDILPCIMVAALHSSVSREQTNWHEIQQWSGNRSLKERLILPNPSHPRLSGFPVTGELGPKHRRISSIHAHHHHRARGCWGQPLMNGERECGRVALITNPTMAEASLMNINKVMST